MSVFNKYKYWIHSAKYNTIQKFVVLMIAILSFMLLARMLGEGGDYGVWGLFMIIAALTETARNALIRNGYIFFSHQHDEKEQSRLQAATFILSSYMSVALAILYLALAKPISTALNAPTLAIMLQVYSVSLLVTIFFSHAETILNSKTDFRGICWMNCVRQAVLLTCIAVYFFTRTKPGPLELSLIYLASVTAGSLVGLAMAKPYLHWQFKGYFEWLPRLWRYGRLVFGNNVFSMLFRGTDVVLTSVLFGATGPIISGYYNASQRIGNLVDMPSAVLADIMFPKVARFNASDKASIKNMYEKAVGATMTFSIPALLLLLIFPETILRILAGEQFVVAASILRVTAFFGFMLPFLKQFGTVIDGTGSPHINFRLMLFGFVINIFIILAFTKLWGVIGTAIGTCTTYFILFLVSQYILNKRFGITITGVLKNIWMFYQEMFHTLKGLLKQAKTSKKPV
jgi:lipopolysaccharide exporter